MDDIFGSEGKKKFAALKEGLIKKYGNPSNEMERVGLELWDEPDEFYQCLAYNGCGLWIAIFEHKESGQNIVLSLKGLRRGEGLIELTYEGPMWSKVIYELEQRKLKADDSAL